jgi:hypothetical protein
MKSFYELAPIGKTFQRLTVIEPLAREVPRTDGPGVRLKWVCRCICGNIHLAEPRKLIIGRLHSCGCYQRERANGYKPKHGMHKSPEYHAWQQMKDRCLNPNSSNWANYGGRGIGICTEWARSFQIFYDYVGAKPSSKHSLGRIDNNKGYEPGNVEWQTAKQQTANRRQPKNKPWLMETKKARAFSKGAKRWWWRGRWRPL